MTATTTVRERASQPWMIRRIIYVATTTLALAAAVFFGVSAETLTQWEQALAPALSVLTAIVSTLAASKTNAGADAGDAPAPVVIENTGTPDLGDVVSDAVERVLDHLLPAGAHRADHTSSLEDLRQGLAIKE